MGSHHSGYLVSHILPSESKGVVLPPVLESIQALACLSRGGERTVRNDSICMKIYSQIIYKPPILMYPRTFGRGGGRRLPWQQILVLAWWWLLTALFPASPLYFPCSVVKFRHTGDSTRSGGEGESQQGQPYGLAAELRGLEALARGEGGAPVPREFANPTDGMKRKTLLQKKLYIYIYIYLFFLFIYSFYFIFHRPVHGGGCGGGYRLRDVSVETVHPHGPVLGKNLATLEGPDQKHEDIDTIVLI